MTGVAKAYLDHAATTPPDPEVIEEMLPFLREQGEPVYVMDVNPTAENIARRVVVSKDAEALVSAAIGGEYEVLFNGVELDAYRSSPSWPTTGPTIFFCGRHEERKGLGVLLEAFAAVSNDARLAVVGDGPQTAVLRRRTAGDRRIVGMGQLRLAESLAREGRVARPGGSAAAARATAVEALVAAAVADHDRAALRAAGRVGLGLEADLLAAPAVQACGDRLERRAEAVRRPVPVGVAIAVPVRVAVRRVTVRVDDRERRGGSLGRCGGGRGLVPLSGAGHRDDGRGRAAGRTERGGAAAGRY